MARAKPIGWIVAGLALLLGGAALAASSTTSKPARKPDEPGEEPQPPTAQPPVQPQAPQTPEAQPPPTPSNLVEDSPRKPTADTSGFFDDLSGQKALRDTSVDEATWEAKFEKHRVGFRDGVLWVIRSVLQLRTEVGLEQADETALAEFDKFVNTFGGAISAAAGGYGALVTAVLKISQYIAYAIVKWGGKLKAVDGREFTGWRDHCWWFRDSPIYGPEARRFWPELVKLFAFNHQQQKALSRLISAYPNGPGMERVEVTPQGDYDYLFNPTKPGDLSQGERDALRVFGQQVYSPEDVTLRGPRGFDPKNPRAWKVPGEAASIYDRVVKLEPGVRAAGL